MTSFDPSHWLEGTMEKLTIGDAQDPANSDLIYLDKCAVCNQPASKTCGNCELEYYCSKEHQKTDWGRHKTKCCNYEMRRHETEGLCIVATKSIDPGTTIVSEYPLAIYNDFKPLGKDLQKLLSISEALPYSCPSCEVGKILPGKIYRCSKCGIPLCKPACENTGSHNRLECQALELMRIRVSENAPVKEVLTDVAILRVLLKEDKKGNPISFDNRKWRALLKKVFSEKLIGEGDNQTSSGSEDIVMSLRAADSLPLSFQFCGNRELIILLHCALTSYGLSLRHDNRRRFLYSKNHSVGHSCTPNAEMWIDNHEKYYKLTIKAIRLIKPGQKITINKAENYSWLPTIERRKKLQTLLGIQCSCKRCRDPTELGTFISALRCEESLSSSSCYGHYISKNPLIERATWKCSDITCKSFKTYMDIKKIVSTAEKELPVVVGQADVLLKKLQGFNEFYSVDVLYHSHFIIRTARARMRQAIKYFLGCGEKLFLCIVNDYPRAYEYGSTWLKSVEAMLFFVEKISPSFNHIRGKLLFEKGCIELALALNESQVLRVHTPSSLIRKVQTASNALKNATIAISIYPHAASLQDSIEFFQSLIAKLFRDVSNLNSDVYPNPSKFTSDAIETLLKRVSGLWKEKSKEIGLVTHYMEPFSSEYPLSIEALRHIIMSDL